MSMSPLSLTENDVQVLHAGPGERKFGYFVDRQEGENGDEADVWHIILIGEENGGRAICVPCYNAKVDDDITFFDWLAGIDSLIHPSHMPANYIRDHKLDKNGELTVSYRTNRLKVIGS